MIGSRGADFLSCREYGNQGMIAVIRFADASLAAWIMIWSSQRIVVRRAAVAGLDDEDVGAADRLLVADIDLAVRERLQLDVAELDVELVGDLLRQDGVRAPREEHQLPGGPALDPAAALAVRLRAVLGRHSEARKRELSRSAFHAGSPPW